MKEKKDNSKKKTDRVRKSLLKEQCVLNYCKYMEKIQSSGLLRQHPISFSKLGLFNFFSPYVIRTNIFKGDQIAFE